MSLCYDINHHCSSRRHPIYSIPRLTPGPRQGPVNPGAVFHTTHRSYLLLRTLDSKELCSRRRMATERLMLAAVNKEIVMVVAEDNT